MFYNITGTGRFPHGLLAAVWAESKVPSPPGNNPVFSNLILILILFNLLYLMSLFTRLWRVVILFYCSHYFVSRFCHFEQIICSPIEEETDRREGKCCRCCFGEGILSIPCHTTDLAPCRMIWRKWLIEERTLGRMDASEKLDDHLVHTTPNHHPSKVNFLPKSFLQIILTDKYG